MKTITTFLIILAASLGQVGFDGPERFKEYLLAYDFKKDPLTLVKQFTIKEPSQPEEPVKYVEARKIANCTVLWNRKNVAILFLTTRPPTESTSSEIGLLLILKPSNKGWKVSDSKRFEAIGKYAGVKAEVTSEGMDSYLDESPVIVTITETQGGRGYSHGLSASYEIDDGKVKKIELE